ncbi:hypothetical protein GQR58_025504 [Nymphon striatum]|nr:hypothetical protein GQR58_025504 [Nymphon striatum]
MCQSDTEVEISTPTFLDRRELVGRTLSNICYIDSNIIHFFFSYLKWSCVVLDGVQWNWHDLEKFHCLSKRMSSASVVHCLSLSDAIREARQIRSCFTMDKCKNNIPCNFAKVCDALGVAKKGSVTSVCRRFCTHVNSRKPSAVGLSTRTPLLCIPKWSCDCRLQEKHSTSCMPEFSISNCIDCIKYIYCRLRFNGRKHLY